jgi:hypothetical protein
VDVASVVGSLDANDLRGSMAALDSLTASGAAVELEPAALGTVAGFVRDLLADDLLSPDEELLIQRLRTALRLSDEHVPVPPSESISSGTPSPSRSIGGGGPPNAGSSLTTALMLGVGLPPGMLLALVVNATTEPSCEIEDSADPTFDVRTSEARVGRVG